MKTIADFKRKMIIGAKVVTKLYYYHPETKEPYLKMDMGERPVSIVQSNSFALATEKPEGIKNSWCDWPKKDEFTVIDENTAKISFQGGYLIYSFVH